MRTVVLGKIIENHYSVDLKQKTTDKDGKIKTVYTDKPVVNKTTEIKDWKEICSFKGEPRYNKGHKELSFLNTINISVDDYVSIIKEVFRADLNELHLFTDKVIEEIDIDKFEADELLVKHIKDFNKTMIESNDVMRDYCDLHCLSYETSDCIKVFNLVFPDKIYEIVDGVMKAKETKYLSSKQIADITDVESCIASAKSYAHTATNTYDSITCTKATVNSTLLDGHVAALSTSIDGKVSCTNEITDVLVWG